MFLLDILPDELIFILFTYAKTDFKRLFGLGDRYVQIYLKINNLVREGQINPDDYFHITDSEFDSLYSKKYSHMVIANNIEYFNFDHEYTSTYDIFYKSKIIKKFFARDYPDYIFEKSIYKMFIYQILYTQEDIPEFNLYKSHTYYVCERHITNVYEDLTIFDYNEEWTKFWMCNLDDKVRALVLDTYIREYY
jgi:hypothetical protein